MSWIGLDIGGANIKMVLANKTANSIEFHLWKKSCLLTDVLKENLTAHLDEQNVAVTMTGEIADCFESKQQGVEFIVNSLQKVVSPQKLFFYQTDGNFNSPQIAIRNWLRTAASNWHALARFSARFLPDQTGMMIDIGSTTTDIIPIIDGEPATSAKTDLQRLQKSELLYTGVTRSPVCSLVKEVEIGGQPTHIAKELFATTLDANLYLGNIKQSQSCESTADGRPATIRCAVKRLARMVCADVDEVEPNDIRAIAERTVAEQQLAIRNAINAVKKRHPQCGKAFIVSGTGDWLAKRVLCTHRARVHLLELAKLESPQINACAPAYAVAMLATELGPR